MSNEWAKWRFNRGVRYDTPPGRVRWQTQWLTVAGRHNTTSIYIQHCLPSRVCSKQNQIEKASALSKFVKNESTRSDGNFANDATGITAAASIARLNTIDWRKSSDTAWSTATSRCSATADGKTRQHIESEGSDRSVARIPCSEYQIETNWEKPCEKTSNN